MRISFINVGYGDSTLVEYFCEKKTYTILIDGGKSEEDHYRGFPNRIRAVDYLRENRIGRIDLLVITHLHEDHVGGLLDVVKNVEIGEVWSNFALPEEYAGKMLKHAKGGSEGAGRLLNAFNIYNELCGMLRLKGKRVKEIVGIRSNLKIIDLLHADILGPTSGDAARQRELIRTVYAERRPEAAEKALVELDGFINKASIAIRLIYGNKRVLLAGDVYGKDWERFTRAYVPIQADILKLPHHGHTDSISEEFIKAVDPEYVVISTSNNRPDNCPNPWVVERLGEHGEAAGRKMRFFFTDSVHMPPYSTSEDEHKAVVFTLHYGNGIDFRKADLKDNIMIKNFLDEANLVSSSEKEGVL